jgi:arylsulfatase A-like enzyme
MVHISDWFPTILELAGIDADPGDGVSLAPVLRGEVQRVARTEMIYNAEILAPSNAHMFVDAPVAIRIGRYKAIFEYEAYWAAADEQQETDDLFGQDGGCFRDSESVFQGYLFDLEKDPYETENLMETHIDIKKNVLDRLEGYLQTVRIEEENMDPLADVLSKWENAGNAVVPWRFTPEDCEGYTVRDCI